METRARTEAFKSLVDNGTYQNGSPYVAFQGERIDDDEGDDEQSRAQMEWGMQRDVASDVADKLKESNDVEPEAFTQTRVGINGRFKTPSTKVGFGDRRRYRLKLTADRLSAERVEGEVEAFESLEDESARLDLEIARNKNLLKAHQLGKMRAQLLELEKERDLTELQDVRDSLRSGGYDNQGRRRAEMLKVAVGDFSRASADDALDSLSNFNVAVKACSLEAVAYSERAGTAEEEIDLSTLVRRFVAKDSVVLASMRAEFGERGGKGSEMMSYLRENFVVPIVYEDTDAENELGKVDWRLMMQGKGTDIKAGLDKVWALTKLLPEGRRGTDAFWIQHVSDRTPAGLLMEYNRHIVTESIVVQQKAASNTRTFAVHLAKARNKMIRRASIFEEVPMAPTAPEHLTGQLTGDFPPAMYSHEKRVLEKGCGRCGMFGCAKAWKEADECDIFGVPTAARMERIKKNEKYKIKVDEYRKEKKMPVLSYSMAAMQHQTGAAYSQSLLDGFPADDFVAAAERLASLKIEVDAAEAAEVAGVWD